MTSTPDPTIDQLAHAGQSPSGATHSIWYQDGGSAASDPLPQSGRADVCIVGAGIAGITTAYLLARAGKRVIVIDEKPIGGGETGRTSAHVSSVLDDRFQHVEAMHGQEGCRLLYQSHAAAIDWIERAQQDERIDCAFQRVDGYLFPAENTPADFLDKELAAAKRAQVRDAGSVARLPVRGAVLPAIRFPHQAVFHPLRYLHGLAGAARRAGASIVTGHRVMDLSGDGPVKAELQQGGTITADFGVAATNVPTPINNWVGIYLKEAPYRTYIIGLEVEDGGVPNALYWDALDPYHYVRLHSVAGRTILLVGGEDHKVGQPGDDLGSRFDRLENWARGHFPGVGARVSAWSGQVSEPEDGVAFIGRVPSKGNAACHVITGDSGMGLTHGTLGATLVTDLILGRQNPWKDLYDPARKQTRAKKDFILENINMAAQFADYLKPADAPSRDAIPRGQGAVLGSGVKRIAVYRDHSGALHERSAVCPHLKCVVRWNAVETSWDCPCHGSRFDCRGKLIIGPAVDDLPPAEPE